MKNLIKIINHKLLLYSILLLSLFHRGYYEIEFADYYVDKAFQISVAKNIDQGLGAKLISVSPVNINEDLIENLTGYTLFYPYLISLFTPYFDYKLAADIIDVIFVSLIVLSCFFILKTLKFNTKTISIFLIFICFVPFPFNVLTSTDLILTSVFIFNTSFLIYVIKNEKLNYKFLLIFSCLVGVLPFIKLSGLAYFLVFPSFFVFNFLINKKKTHLLYAIILATLSSLILLVLFYNFPFYAKAKSTESFGFYPENLLSFDPFIQKSLLNINDYLKGLFFYSNLKPLFIMLNFFVLGVLFYRVFIKSKKNEIIELILLTSLIIVILFYTSLSLLTEGENWKNPPWTYVESSRYFGGLSILFHLSIFTYWNKAGTNVFKFSLAFILMFNFLISFKGFYNNTILQKDMYNFKYNNSERIICSKFIKSIKTKKKKIYLDLSNHSGHDENFIYANSDIYRFIMNKSYNFEAMNNKSYTFFIRVPDYEIEELNNYLKKNKLDVNNRLILKNSVLLCVK